MRVLILALALMAAGAALAETPPPAEQALQPVRHGYAAEDSGVLLRQRLFGLAHGVHLLLSACLDKAANAAEVQNAYDAWYAEQEKTLGGLRLALAQHHFGAQADAAQWQDIARIFGLKETIYPVLGEISLEDACASFPEALRQPRYDFAAQLEKSNDDREQRR